MSDQTPPTTFKSIGQLAAEAVKRAEAARKEAAK